MDRSYTYLESTTSLCSECLERISAQIVNKNGRVYVKKTCPTHGEQLELMEEDSVYFSNRQKFNKPGTISKVQTTVEKGCPYDCGLCPAHDQHTCIGLIEITNACDLGCPICYAHSGKGIPLNLAKIEAMMDCFVDSEFGNAEILQISGGEPTTHPDIIEIIKRAKTKNIAYVMLNTNGLRIAHDRKFVEELRQFSTGFEVYLQFDGFSPDAYRYLRGKDISHLKEQAIQNLSDAGIPVTLVSTIEHGVNDHEVGDIVRFGLETPCIRGVNFQPVAYFGRGTIPDRGERITLTGIIKRLYEQVPEILQEGDIVPLPCNVERNALTFLFENANHDFVPITRGIPVEKLVPQISNTFAFNADTLLNNNNENTVCTTCNCINLTKVLKKLMPTNFIFKSQTERKQYIDEHIFRISITSFVDRFNFDMHAMQKECIHIITPDLKKIPFSAYNMLHRP